MPTTNAQATEPITEHRRLSMRVDASFLNDHIMGLVEEGNIATAWKTTESLLSGEEDKTLRTGLITEVISGQKRFENAPDGCYTLEDVDDEHDMNTDVPAHGTDTMHDTSATRSEHKNALLAHIDKLEDALESKDKEMRALVEQILFMSEYVCEHKPCFYDDLMEAWEDEKAGRPHANSYSSYDDYDGDSDCGDDNDDATIDGTYGTGSNPLSPEVCDFIDTFRRDTLGPEYGWLSPEGEFFDVPWGHHTGWAWDYVKENEIASKPGEFGMDAGDLLVEKGWVLMHNPMKGTGRATMKRDGKLTLPQKDFLVDYYKNRGKDAAADAVRRGWYDELPEFFDLI